MGSFMNKEIQEILTIVREEQQQLQELRKDFQKERSLNTERDKNFINLRKDLQEERNQLWKAFTEEQAINTHRYYELKRSIDDVYSRMATKDQLNQVFESLSQDIAFLSGGHHRLKKRVSFLEKRVGKLEDQVS